MNILLVASEAHPFIKTGGLGDVIGALPNEISKLGENIRVVVPKYSDISEGIKKKLKYIGSFTVNVGWRNQYCGIFEYNYNGVKFYFLDNEYYFKRSGLYGYYDDGERFAFFSRAVLEFIKHIDWIPEIIHCNDWQTAMIPVLYKLEYAKDNKLKNIKTVLSIHNLLFKGMYSPEILPELFGYDYEPYFNGSLEHNGAISILKGGINYSDKILTVSKTYADEIKTQEYGEGLHGLLKYRENYLEGIVNGIDYTEYNPKTDKYIWRRYDFKTIEDKGINKENLQKELNLPINKEIPLLGLVSRLTNQKGCNLIINILNELLNEDIQIVILGTGDYYYEEEFRKFSNIYPDKLSANIKFSNELAHQIYASADMFLMPSLFEPCGLGQLIALRYGAIPIVRETGGLKDTVDKYDEDKEEGNGFTFKNYDNKELLNTVKYALNIFKNKDRWNKIIENAMKADNSWERSSREYIRVYRELVNSID